MSRCLRELRKMGSIYNQTPSHKPSLTSAQVYAQMGHIKRLRDTKKEAQ